MKRPPLERHSAMRYALVYARGTRQCATIRSISRHGIRLDGAFGLEPGDAVTVELPSMPAIDGKVEWSVAAFCGIAFNSPLAETDPVLTDTLAM
ncbi:MAG: hypothetical protein M5U16_06320 [Hyphomicrobium sp.]|nr:hypothetical protein [Hyphomicrobium sp.]